MGYIKFTKMHGLGNNYIYVDCTTGRDGKPKNLVEDPEALSRHVSDKNFGIGSDGLILIKASEKADFFMDIYNADGSRGKMCGNGIRCVAKYVYENGLTDKTSLDIDTLSGVKHIEIKLKEGAGAGNMDPAGTKKSERGGYDADAVEEDAAAASGMGTPERRNTVELVSVDMGAASFKPEDVPVLTEKSIFKREPIDACGETYYSTCVSVGNPHCVTFIDDVESLDLEGVGSVFECMDIFPDRINAEFATVIDREHVRMRVYERGSGITSACGTGACATAAAAHLCGYTDSKVEILLDGGALLIELRGGTIFMSGPAAYVCGGVIQIL